VTSRRAVEAWPRKVVDVRSTASGRSAVAGARTGWGCVVVRNPIWTFVRHYLEMIVAMLLGMALYRCGSWRPATLPRRAGCTGLTSRGS
jgi:hypothetical protein